MKMIVNTKTKKQEKAVKDFLDDHDIKFSMVEDKLLFTKRLSQNT